MIAAAHQPLFLPWVGYFHKIDKADVFVFADNVQFTTSGWIARNKVKTPNGSVYLTVPIKNKHHVGQIIKDVKISDENNTWRSRHLSILKANYARSPFYQEVMNIINYVINKPWENLADLNIDFIHAICDYLEIDTRLILGSELGAEGKKTDLIIDICKKTNADSFIIGQGASSRYVDRAVLEESDIKYVPQNFVHPEYSQNFEGFIQNLSIVDLLFNVGKKSIDLIREPLAVSRYN